MDGARSSTLSAPRTRESFGIWAVKASFCRYVEALPDGFCAVSYDVRRLEGGQFVLPGTLSESGDRITWSSPASLRFTGHGGMLSVGVGELRLELAHTPGSLFVTPEPDADPLRLATASVAARSDSAVLVDLALTAEGAALFGDNYPPGEPLDSLRLVVAPES
ncbi:hypothetical protein GCM10009808_24860 [Microbacterium sediminicola]|uniref:Htaa domain-containing protein n=1 Tax=Microbacterium sediminicola TaxID=415210 RepID=A0ABP4UL70_9MICO